MRLAFLFFLLGCLGTAHAGWFGPKNYDECILENMRGVTLVQAVWAIQNSCRAKFPEACYAWQKKQVAKPKRNPWDRQPTRYELTLDSDPSPDGCGAVLR